jgi:pilus assembly protein CpaC
LELEPEVSTIDFQNGVKFQGYLIPALKTRRAKTGIELRDGQSFALAGLLDNSESSTLSKVPGLGNIPILGALFKSKSFEKRETELVFFCTTNIIKPLDRDALPATRSLDGLKKGSPLGLEPQGEGIKGASGYSTGSEGAKATTVTDANVNANAASVNATTTTTATTTTPAATDAGGATQTAAPAATPAAAPAKEDKDAVKEAAKVEVKEQAATPAPELPPAGDAARLALLNYFGQLPAAPVASAAKAGVKQQ